MNATKTQTAKLCKTCNNARWVRLDSGMIVLKCGNDQKNGFDKCENWFEREGAEK